MGVSGVIVLLGGLWGDEGKGKLVDLLSVEADFVCRCHVSDSFWLLKLLSLYNNFTWKL